MLMGTSRDRDGQLKGPDQDDDQARADSGGQSGDAQGLSPFEDAADESVEELADTGQDYEAEVLMGLEDAADHPERPVHTLQDQSRPPEIAPDRRSE